MFGLGVNRLGATNQKPFSPASLFNNGEAGVWYDPSAASGSLDWRKNLFEYTESFDNNYWVKSGVTVTANVTEAPDGENTADKMAATAGQAEHRVRVYNIVGSGTSTISIYAKKGEYNYLGFRIEINNVWSQAVFDLHLGVLGVATNTFDARTIEDVGNGWYRCSATFTSTTATQLQIHVQPTNSINPVYTGDGSSGIYIWGAQVEEASTASSYQPILSTFESAFKAAFPSHTLYQDSNGETPVTAVGEPVGLMLDKSKGLAQGPELVTNGDFATDSGWSKGTGWTIANGNAAQSGGVGQLAQAVSIAVGVRCRFTFTVVIQAGTLRISAGPTAPVKDFSESGTYTFDLPFSGSAVLYFLGTSSSFVGSIDNVSVTEIQGSHATQPTSTKRPIYARHPEGGIRNLLNYTEQFDNGYWNKLASTVNPNAGIAPDGTQTADRLNFTTSSSSRVEVTIFPSPTNVPMVMSIWLKSESGNQTVQIGEQTKSTVTATTEWQRFTHSYNDPDGYIYPRIENSDDGVARSVLAWGAQVEEATEATNYQKVVTDIDVTESGVGEVYYLKFDGTDDGMQINNLSSTSTPLTALFGYSATNAESAAVRYLLDIETGRTVLAASAAVTGQIGYLDGQWSEFAADADAIKVLTYDLVENDAKIRIDGTQEYSDTTYDQKAIGARIGLFQNYPFTGSQVAGNMYQTILRAAESTDEEIAKAETFVANKTGLKAQVDGIATLDLNFGANTYTAKNSNGGVI